MEKTDKSVFEPGEKPARWADSLNFACQGCGGCCTATTPFVTPLDIWRIARFTGNTTGEILEQCIIVFDEACLDGTGTSVPLLALEMVDPGAQCGFLDRETHLCHVYPARPLSCRMFPAGIRWAKGLSGRSRRKPVLVNPLPECRGYGLGSNTLREYLDLSGWKDETGHSADLLRFTCKVFQSEGLADDAVFVDSFMAALYDLDSRPGHDFARRYAAGKRLVRSWL